MKTKALQLLIYLLLCSCGIVGAQELVQPVDPYGTDTTALADADDFADSAKLVTVEAIVIEGNKRTREATILRELTFRKNDQFTLEKLGRKCRDSRQFLMNTGLFYSATVSVSALQGTQATVLVTVKERWLVQPEPVFKTIDGGELDMRRVNWGVRLNTRNITGRNDKLYLYFMAGYNHQVAFRYEGLYLDKGMKWSAAAGAAFSKSHTLSYATANNQRLQFRDNNRYIQTYFYPQASISYRPAMKIVHTFSAGYYRERIADTVTKLNPFYADGHKSFHYPELGYKLAYTDVDFLPYPTKGLMGETSLIKKGFGLDFNLWQLSAKTSVNWHLSEKNSASVIAAGMLKVPFKQPYIMQPLMEQLNLQGFEDYVLDGVAGGYTKAILRRQLLNTNIRVPKSKSGLVQKINSINSIPLRIYGKMFGNVGYAYHTDAEKNQLNNQLLLAGGFGVDIVMLADFVLKIEWSFNQLGRNGLSLRQRSPY